MKPAAVVARDFVQRLHPGVTDMALDTQFGSFLSRLANLIEEQRAMAISEATAAYRSFRVHGLVPSPQPVSIGITVARGFPAPMPIEDHAYIPMPNGEPKVDF